MEGERGGKERERGWEGRRKGEMDVRAGGGEAGRLEGKGGEGGKQGPSCEG
jgi:hypothetical protein